MNKYGWLLLCVLLSGSTFNFGIVGTRLAIPSKSRQVIVHFSQIPSDGIEHTKWNTMIEDSLNEINEILIDNGFIAPRLKKPDDDASQWDKFMYRVKSLYYTIFYRTHTLKYPKKENFVFFTRTDRDLGHYTIHIPDGVPDIVFVDYLKKIYANLRHFCIKKNSNPWRC